MLGLQFEQHISVIDSFIYHNIIYNKSKSDWQL